MNKNFIDRSDTLISKYFRDVSKYKMLDAETTNDLIVKAQKGDKVAKDKVVCANLRFVVKVAKPFQNKGIPLIDLISAGNCGLIKAIDYFDTNRGVKFLMQYGGLNKLFILLFIGNLERLDYQYHNKH